MRVLVTGAAGGLGASLVEQLIAERHIVIALDTAHNKSTTYNADSSPREIKLNVDLADRIDLTNFVRTMTEIGPIDVVIHCAAISATGCFATIPMDKHESVVRINLLAPLLLTSALLKHQLISAHGTLVFVGSLSSYVSYPGASVYAATKDGLLSYGRSLSKELAKLRIHSLCVLPGPLQTRHAEEHAPPNSNASSRLNPSIAAQKILLAIERKRRYLVPGFRANVFRFASIVAPRSTERFMRTHIYLPLISR